MLDIGSAPFRLPSRCASKRLAVSLTVNQKQKTHTQRLTTTHVGRVISQVGKAAGVIVDEGDPRTGRGGQVRQCP